LIVALVLLSLGANLGDPIETLSKAIDMLRTGVLDDVRVSALYQTEPVGVTNQPRFINVSVAGTSESTPRQIHDACKEIERRLGRRQRQRWHEREIDIDVILVGNSILDEEDVHIPHLRRHERRFVLQPSCDIVPDAVCPRTGKPLSQLLDECSDVVSRPIRCQVTGYR